MKVTRKSRQRLRRINALALAAAFWLQGVSSEMAVALAQPGRPASNAPRSKAKQASKAVHVSPVIEACVEHHTDAQELRMAGKLLDSRIALRRCAAEACPALLQRDCVGWLDELEAQVPSLTFRVTVGGQSRSDAQIYIDGVLAAEPAQGKAVDLDPGQHRLRVIVQGVPPHEEELTLNEGERYRLVEVSLAAPAEEEEPQAAPKPALHRPVPLATYILGSVALAGAVSGGIWAVSSASLRQQLEDSCAPDCGKGRVDELRQRALITDLSWGISAVSLLGAAAFFVFRPELPVDVDVALTPGGGIGLVQLQSF